MNSYLVLGVSAVLAFLLIPVLARLVGLFALAVEHEEAVLVTRFGKLAAVITQPGWHWLPDRILPWVGVRRASLQRDFRHFRDVHINSVSGTTMLVDLWLELRITDPKRALYDVADWDRSLQNLVQHAAISILGSREFQEILTDRVEIGELLKRDIGAETARWGVSIEQVFVRNVSLLPEVSRQVFETIAARLERAKADIEEEGRLLVALLEAKMSLQIAPLVADAKGQYPAALDRAFANLGREPAVLTAYNELYELSLVRPHRTITFSGFAEKDLSPVDAMMAAPPLSDGHAPTYGVPPLSSQEDRVFRSTTLAPRIPHQLPSVDKPS